MNAAHAPPNRDVSSEGHRTQGSTVPTISKALRETDRHHLYRPAEPFLEGHGPSGTWPSTNRPVIYTAYVVERCAKRMQPRHADVGDAVLLLSHCRACAGACRPGCRGLLTGHAATFLGAAPTGLCTRLAMLHRMACTFCGTRLTDLRADSANHCRKFTTAAHETSRSPANRSAIDVQRNALGHRLQVVFFQASGSTAIARARTFVTSVDTRLDAFVRHVSSLV